MRRKTSTTILPEAGVEWIDRLALKIEGAVLTQRQMRSNQPTSIAASNKRFARMECAHAWYFRAFRPTEIQDSLPWLSMPGCVPQELRRGGSRGLQIKVKGRSLPEIDSKIAATFSPKPDRD